MNARWSGPGELGLSRAEDLSEAEGLRGALPEGPDHRQGEAERSLESLRPLVLLADGSGARLANGAGGGVSAR